MCRGERWDMGGRLGRSIVLDGVEGKKDSKGMDA